MPPRRKPWPSGEEMKRSMSYHATAYRPETGKETELLNKLVEGAKMTESESGVLQVNVYQIVYGKGPNYVAMLVAKNPGVAQKLSKNRNLQKIDNDLKGLAKKVKRDQLSTALKGRIGL